LGRDRDRVAGKRVMVTGAGHSAANTLLDLAELGSTTVITWAVRTADLTRVYGGGEQDELSARGALGSQLRELVDSGRIKVLTSFTITRFSGEDALTVHAVTPDGEREVTVDVLVPATGFRPELRMLSELRLNLDPAVEAPAQLGPLIDPEFHSCGSVEPHGERVLAHPEKNFYIVGMKSYGRAPTFLMATGYEQVRSIAASLAGDRDAADAVRLELRSEERRVGTEVRDRHVTVVQTCALPISEFHSCGSVEPHGERVLAHPEKNFYIVGMKSYGRAPTFLMATGYEQVRSIAASLAGDRDAADAVRLEL